MIEVLGMKRKEEPALLLIFFLPHKTLNAAMNIVMSLVKKMVLLIFGLINITSRESNKPNLCGLYYPAASAFSSKVPPAAGDIDSTLLPF